MDPIPLASVVQRLRLGPHELVSMVGAGGKSTLTFAIAAQLSGRRIVTTTTKMGLEQFGDAPVLVGPADDEIAAALADHDVVQVWRAVDHRKAFGCNPDDVGRWLGLADHVIVESDGARRNPFKAPKVFEPPVPALTTTAIGLIGAEALGRVIADRCHRPMRVAAAGGCSPYERLTPEIAARVLTSERGTRKNIPAEARYVVAINKVKPGDQLAAELADILTDAGQESLTIAHEPNQPWLFRPLGADIPSQDITNPR